MSCWNWVERDWASSMACFWMTRPPTLTTSVPTVPEAEEPSPYEIFQDEPEEFWNVLDWVGSKMVWLVPDVVAEGSSVDQSCTTVSAGFVKVGNEAWYVPRDRLIQCRSLE